MHLIEDHAEQVGIPVRFAASKVMEGDAKIQEQLNLTKEEQHILSEILYLIFDYPHKHYTFKHFEV